MSQILLELDNQLKQTDIVMPLTETSMSEVGEKNYNINKNRTQQTSVHGILSPLIRINDVNIGFRNIISFELSSKGPLPTLELVVNDEMNIIEKLDNPGPDNEIRVQILPPFENAYKKINLTFYITSIDINMNIISLSGIYKLPDLTSTRFKSLGELDTYSIFKKIAIDTKLGFATNIKIDKNDTRYAYCDNISYLDLMNREIEMSGDKNHIFDYWIDFWNNINLADIKERYTTIDDNKDLLIWVTGQHGEVEQNILPKPVQILAMIGNNLKLGQSDLKVDNYTINNNRANAISGTDKIYSVFEDSNEEYMDYLIQNGDVKNDIYLKHEYLGEVYGDYNYLISKKLREAYLEKINNEYLIVHMSNPVLGLMRGHKVIFSWYNNSSLYNMERTNLAKYDLLTKNEPNMQLENIDSITGDDSFKLDENISGQYLISGVSINFENNQWDYSLILCKPKTNKVNN